MIRILLSVLCLTGLCGEVLAQKKGDTVQGDYIIRRTKKGIIKVPRRQSFRFGDQGIEAEANRPSQSVLGAREGRRNLSLIPIRTSFRKELVGVSGIQER